MRYTYSVTSPGGKRFGDGSCTAILVPSVQYPSGYSVTVEGARVTSRPDAGVLTLAQVRGVRSTVTLELRPASGGQIGALHSGALNACQ
jgi:endoglycosylceramidase